MQRRSAHRQSQPLDILVVHFVLCKVRSLTHALLELARPESSSFISLRYMISSLKRRGVLSPKEERRSKRSRKRRADRAKKRCRLACFADGTSRYHIANRGTSGSTWKMAYRKCPKQPLHPGSFALPVVSTPTSFSLQLKIPACCQYDTDRSTRHPATPGAESMRPLAAS